MESKGSIVENSTKRKVFQGGLAASLNVSRLRTADAAGLAASCGFDWLFIDMEHNSIEYSVAADMCVAALATGITPIARVAGHEPNLAARMLDAGAQGIVVPHVDTADQARAVANACLYPPLGGRSLTAPLPQARFRPVPFATLMEEVNKQTLVVVMLETASAIENAEEIAAVPGIDVLMIGTNDLAADLGIAGQLEHESIQRSYARTIAACKGAGKVAGMGGVYDQELIRRYVEMGVRFMLGGSDVSFMMEGGKRRAEFVASLQAS